MKNSYLIIFTFVAALIGPNVSVADNFSVRKFIGLWEAVDPSDGSLARRSISCDQDRRCSILGSDSFWLFCGSPRGILRGEGFIENRKLRVPEFTVTCTEDQRELVIDTTFIFDRRNRTLLEKHVNPNIPTTTFHKASR